MKKIVYYKKDNRFANDMKPIYKNAPWYLWLLNFIFGKIGIFFFDLYIKTQNKIQDL